MPTRNIHDQHIKDVVSQDRKIIMQFLIEEKDKVTEQIIDAKIIDGELHLEINTEFAKDNHAIMVNFVRAIEDITGIIRNKYETFRYMHEKLDELELMARGHKDSLEERLRLQK